MRFACFLAACLTGAVPSVATAHSEGTEIADPSSRSAPLAFESAVGLYTALSGERLAWRSAFSTAAATDPTSDAAEAAAPQANHAAHGGEAAEQPAPPDMRR
jgi:hypothetical protein